MYYTIMLNFIIRFAYDYDSGFPIKQALVNDWFCFQLTNSTSSATEMVVLNVIFESGTGSEVLIGIKGQLGTIQREYSYNFA